MNKFVRVFSIFIISLFCLTACLFRGGEPAELPGIDHVFYTMVSPLGNKQIRWSHADHKYYGAQMKWGNFAKGTQYEAWGPSLVTSSMPDNDNGHESMYQPGCTPTALGQLMYYFLKYRYPEVSKDISSINMTKSYSIMAWHNNSSEGIRGQTLT
jgi:hypothetical protein